MKPVEFVGQSTILSPPPDTPRGEIGALPVAVYGWGMKSYWRPSDEELEQLQNGGHVRLDVAGLSHPPVMLTVERVEELP